MAGELDALAFAPGEVERLAAAFPDGGADVVIETVGKAAVLKDAYAPQGCDRRDREGVG